MNSKLITVIFILLNLCLPDNSLLAAEHLSIEKFIQLATQNDTVFEEILIDELSLTFEKDLNLPARDLILEIKNQYDFFIDTNREEDETILSLSKLFPTTGTKLTAEYKNTPSFTSFDSSSSFSFNITQSIAENAFGQATRFKDKIIGIEIDVARYQIIEAYEDYLATLVLAYYDWFESYENLRIANSSYQENVKLLDNIKEREKSKIALPIDVNKINIQVLKKKEKQVDLNAQYLHDLQIIKTAIRHTGKEDLIPQIPDKYVLNNIPFDTTYKTFTNSSRTYQVLNLLQKKSSLNVKKNAHVLLPSIDLLAGYEVKGSNLSIEDEDNMYFAGVSVEWPFPDQVKKAEYEVSRINLKKTKLNIDNTDVRLHTTLTNLYLEIEREKELSQITKKKITLAQSVLNDETENYSFGKVTLNDYIDAVNTLDNNRFTHVLHTNKLRKLTVEWLRITDQLIHKNAIATLN